MSKLINSVNKFLDFRDSQEALLGGGGDHSGCKHAVGKKKHLFNIT